MKAIEQYFHVVLFIMLYKGVLTFKSVDETIVCDNEDVCECSHNTTRKEDPKKLVYDHTNESYFYAVYGGFTLLECRLPIQIEAMKHKFYVIPAFYFFF